MLFNLSWNDKKSKIAIAIVDEEELPAYIYIKKDLSNAFNKKMIKSEKFLLYINDLVDVNFLSFSSSYKIFLKLQECYWIYILL